AGPLEHRDRAEHLLEKLVGAGCPTRSVAYGESDSSSGLRGLVSRLASGVPCILEGEPGPFELARVPQCIPEVDQQSASFQALLLEQLRRARQQIDAAGSVPAFKRSPSGGSEALARALGERASIVTNRTKLLAKSIGLFEVEADDLVEAAAALLQPTGETLVQLAPK